MKKSSRPIKPPVSSPLEPVIQFPVAWRYIGMVWAVGIFAFFLNQFPISLGYVSHVLGAMTEFNLFHAYLLKVLFGFAVGSLIVIVAARSGALLIQWRLPDAALTKVEFWVLGSALTLGLLAISVLGFGAVQLWYAPVFLALLLALGGWSVSAALTSAPVPAQRPLPWAPVWKIVVILIGLLYVLGAAAPEIFYDSLHYHLGIPNLYRLMHGIHAVPTMLYADFVMNIQMLYGLAITLGNTLSAKAIHVGTCVLLGLGFIAFGRRFFRSASGWLAAGLFFSIPMVGINATTAGTDVAGAFLLFAAAAALVLALERKTLPYFSFAGFLMGIAASAKFPAFTFIPVGGVLILWHFIGDEKKSWREWSPAIVHFLGFAMLGLAPILLKNVALHANPLYPFGGSFIGHPRVDPVEWGKFISDTSPRDVRAAFSSLPAFGRFLAEPWFLTFSGQGTVGPLMLMGLPFLVRRTTSLPYRTFQRFALLLWLIWLFTSTVPRYGLPSMVLACPLMAEALVIAAGSGMRWILFSVFGLGMLANLALQLAILFSWEGWKVVAGNVSEEVYMGQTHSSYPMPPYDGLLWMNQNLPKDAVVLFAGDSRSYYLERRSIPSSIPGPQPVVLWAEQSHTGEELAQKIRATGATHIFVNLAEAIRTDSYRVFSWDAAGWGVFDDFWSHHVRMIWKKESQDRNNPEALYAFEIVPEAQARQPHPPAPNPFERWRPK
jgi:hypothetical protein